MVVVEEEEREVGAVEVELVERMRRGMVLGLQGWWVGEGRVVGDVGLQVASFAPERRRGRQVWVIEGACVSCGEVVSVDVRERPDGESFITRASLCADGVVSLTAGKRLYFFACGSVFSSSKGRGERGVRPISSSPSSSSPAPNFASTGVSTFAGKPKSNLPIAESPAQSTTSGLCIGGESRI